MKFEQLVSLLQAEANVLNARGVGARLVRHWIEASLLLPSQRASCHPGRNPTWDTPDENLDRGKRLLMFRSQGTTRSSGLMVRLWLEGFKCPLLMVQEGLADEIDRIAKRIFPDGYPAWMRPHETMTPEQVARRGASLGPLDHRLAAFQASDETYVRLAAAYCVGDEGEFDEAAVIVSEVARLVPEVAELIEGLASEVTLAGWLSKPLDRLIPSPNRTLIMGATTAEMTAMRTTYQALKWLFQDTSILDKILGGTLGDGQRTALAAAAYSLNSLEWEVLVSVLTLRLQQVVLSSDGGFNQLDSAIAERLFQSESVRRMVEPLLALDSGVRTPSDKKAP